MNELLSHPKLILEVLVIYWAFSAIVSSMPKPPTGAFWYSWLYDFLHAFAGNLQKFMDQRVQSLEESVTVTKTTQSATPAGESK